MLQGPTANVRKIEVPHRRFRQRAGCRLPAQPWPWICFGGERSGPREESLGEYLDAALWQDFNLCRATFDAGSSKTRYSGLNRTRKFAHCER